MKNRLSPAATWKIFTSIGGKELIVYKFVGDTGIRQGDRK